MNQVTRLELALKALSLLFLVIAAGVLLWPVALPEATSPLPGLTAPAGTRVLASADPASARTVVTANIFSARRAPPATRYRPYFSEAESAPAQPRVVPQAGDQGSAEDRVPQLFGIVQGPAGSTALLRLDPAAPGSLVYREGDRGGAYQVVKIEERSVVLNGPKGQIVLRLNRPQGETR